MIKFLSAIPKYVQEEDSVIKFKLELRNVLIAKAFTIQQNF